MISLPKKSSSLVSYTTALIDFTKQVASTELNSNYTDIISEMNESNKTTETKLSSSSLKIRQLNVANYLLNLTTNKNNKLVDIDQITNELKINPETILDHQGK
jgi:hypothetical protein